MKVILALIAGKGKNVVFVSDTLRAYTLEEAVRLAKDKKLEGVYAVNGKHGAYLRTLPHVTKKEELEQLAVSSHKLFTAAYNTRTALSTPPLARYLQLFEHLLQKDGGPFITIEGKVRATKKEVREKLYKNKDYIFDAAKKFKVDPYLLGAIIIDEIAQLAPFEEPLEKLAVFFVGKNASAGIAQVKIDTARGLIRDGYYNPDPNSPKLSPDRVGKTSRLDLYEYVRQPKHSIFFASARMRELTDKWKKFVDLGERPEIVATLYSRKERQPHGNPQPNERGLQISDEFYQLAKEWLR